LFFLKLIVVVNMTLHINIIVFWITYCTWRDVKTKAWRKSWNSFLRHAFHLFLSLLHIDNRYIKTLKNFKNFYRFGKKTKTQIWPISELSEQAFYHFYRLVMSWAGMTQHLGIQNQNLVSERGSQIYVIIYIVNEMIHTT